VILLKPTIKNQVALTLTEMVTLPTPYYLFELINKQSKEKKYFIGQDTSLYSYRYNLFEIEVKSNPNPLVSEVDLKLGDEYDYYVYEQSSPTNLDPANASGLLEEGILRYEKARTELTQYERPQTERAVYTRA
jgi:hypothetical protein